VLLAYLLYIQGIFVGIPTSYLCDYTSSVHTKLFKQLFHDFSLGKPSYAGAPGKYDRKSILFVKYKACEKPFHGVFFEYACVVRATTEDHKGIHIHTLWHRVFVFQGLVKSIFDWFYRKQI